MTEDQIRELFDAKLAHIADLNEAQSSDISEIKTTVNCFAAGCRARHEKLDHELGDLKAGQAFSCGQHKARADFTTSAYAKLGAVFTLVAAVIALMQWLLTKG